MKDDWNQIELRDDLTRDFVSDAELAQICWHATRSARKRRVAGQLKIIAGVATLAAGVWFGQRQQQGEQSAALPTAARPQVTYTLVKTEPFDGVISSQRLEADAFFVSVEPMATLTTPAEPAYKEISDDELMRLFAGRSVAFLREPSGRLKVQFLDEKRVQ
jgi:hypothetical protein